MTKGLRRSLKKVYDVLDVTDTDTLIEVATLLGERQTLTAAGASALAGVTVTEMGTDAMRRTRLTLVDAILPMVSITTGNGIGGAVVYDFPEGFIMLQGVTGNLAISVATAKQADFTDATPEGDIGIGSVIITDPTAFSTDATDDDYQAGIAFIMAAFAAPAVGGVTAAAQLEDGSSTAVNVVVNAFTDAADINEATTTEVLINGTIDVVWSLIGDV